MQTQKTTNNFALLMLGALGVVYGDIGTSPLYTLKAVFNGTNPLAVNMVNVLGVISLIFWSLIIVVSLKYIMFVMRADNNGEGGIMALLALALRNAKGKKRQYRMLMMLGILGAALFYGDGVITPAISILSAIEGIELADSRFSAWVIPVTVVIVFLLFLFQHKGTAIIGRFFGPVMFVWFVSIGILGLLQIINYPDILAALNPTHAVTFFVQNKWFSFIVLGVVFLALTGAEALYADMGHFGRSPISASWYAFVLPALVLNYFGQGALLLEDPSTIANPFYLLAPEWLLYPLICLATVATIIASQSVISGIFSTTQQAMRLGYLPRMEVQHTSEQTMGQIYLPAVNWMIFAGVVLVILTFKSSTHLGAAYGISVTGTMIITTVLAFFVIHHLLQWRWWHSFLIFGSFLIVDLTFFSANLLKVAEGGWLPLLIASMVFILMTTWRRGNKIISKRRLEMGVELNTFVDNVSTLYPVRVMGTAVFLTGDATLVPRALIYNLNFNKVLHERVVVLKVSIEDIPHVAIDERLSIAELPQNFYVINLRYGFKDEVDVPRALLLCEEYGVKFSLLDTAFFLSKELLVYSKRVSMVWWREKLFFAMFRNAGSVTRAFKLPAGRVFELGTQVEF
jgi:KUP system potassium uptake protein